jgi:RimJ/RimL family protein N-acetyltransferase
VKLVPISEHPDHARILYDLLAERPIEANISHKQMPNFSEHLSFVAYHDPKSEYAGVGAYEDWCLIENDADILGSIYLTTRYEIGVAIFSKYQGKGFGTQAVQMLMAKHGKRAYLANVAPTNPRSRKMFEKLGFRVIQETLALDAD